MKIFFQDNTKSVSHYHWNSVILFFLNFSGSVDLNEAGSSVSSISQSRGISVENELAALRGSSQSSDEGMSTVGITDRCNARTLAHRY